MGERIGLEFQQSAKVLKRPGLRDKRLPAYRVDVLEDFGLGLECGQKHPSEWNDKEQRKQTAEHVAHDARQPGSTALQRIVLSRHTRLERGGFIKD